MKCQNISVAHIEAHCTLLHPPTQKDERGYVMHSGTAWEVGTVKTVYSRIAQCQHYTNQPGNIKTHWA